jgi:hypothetical protein
MSGGNSSTAIIKLRRLYFMASSEQELDGTS